MPAYYPNAAAYDQNDTLDIDLSTVEEASFEPIPPGEYQAQAVKVNLTYSQSGNLMVQAEFAILGGQYDNRRIFENYSVRHQNPQVVEIALRAIKSWAIACGYSGNERLTADLLKALEGRELIARVGIEKDKTGQYGDKNRIRGCRPVPGGAPQVNQHPVPPPQVNQPAPQPQARQPAPRGQSASAPASPAPGHSKRVWEK